MKRHTDISLHENSARRVMISYQIVSLTSRLYLALHCKVKSTKPLSLDQSFRLIGSF